MKTLPPFESDKTTTPAAASSNTLRHPVISTSPGDKSLTHHSRRILTPEEAMDDRINRHRPLRREFVINDDEQQLAARVVRQATQPISSSEDDVNGDIYTDKMREKRSGGLYPDLFLPYGLRK